MFQLQWNRFFFSSMKNSRTFFIPIETLQKSIRINLKRFSSYFPFIFRFLSPEKSSSIVENFLQLSVCTFTRFHATFSPFFSVNKKRNFYFCLSNNRCWYRNLLLDVCSTHLLVCQLQASWIISCLCRWCLRCNLQFAALLSYLCQWFVFS